jgi:hypothetical protein
MLPQSKLVVKVGAVERMRNSSSWNRNDAAAAATANSNRRFLVKFKPLVTFFKWIKQHLRIKRFYGTSENVVRTQIWIAISVYVLVAIIKKKLWLDVSLHTLLQILSLTLFEKLPLAKTGGYPRYSAIEMPMLRRPNRGPDEASKFVTQED